MVRGLLRSSAPLDLNFRLVLMQAPTQRLGDPDSDLPSMLAKGVHTGVFSEIKPSSLWPPAKLQPLS